MRHLSIYCSAVRFLLILGSVVLLGSASVSAQLSGSYTIDASKAASKTNYRSVVAAAQDLRIGTRPDGGTANGPGVSSAVDFSLSDTTFTGQVRFGKIKGVSATNTVTFQSASGNAAKVVITFPSTATTGGGTNFTLMLDSTRYFTFKNISLVRTGAGVGGVVVYMRNGACQNNFTGCNLTGEKTLSNTVNRSVVYSPATKEDSNSFVSNTIRYGSYALNLAGTSAAIHERNNIFRNNTIDSNSTAGGYFTFSDNIMFEGNTVSNIFGATTYGLYVNNSDSAIKIDNNIINAGVGGHGLYMGTCRGVKAFVFNNFITVTSPLLRYGIYASTISGFNFYFNSVNVSSTNAGSRAFYGLTGGTTSKLFNNIFVNTGGGAAIEITASAVTSKLIDSSDFNDFYVTGTNLGIWNAIAQTTIAAWRTASGKDANSLAVNPNYYSATDLHITSPGIIRKGKAISGFNADIDGQVRSIPNSDMGADETMLFPDDIWVNAFVSPYGNLVCGDSNTVIGVVLTNNGSNNHTKVPFGLKVSGATSLSLTDTFNKTILSLARDTFYFTTKLNTFAGGIFNIKVFSALTGDANGFNDTITTSANFLKSGIAPTTTGASRCGFGPLTLHASAAPVGYRNLWFANAVTDTVLSFKDSFTTPSLGASKTYYVAGAAKATGYLGAKDTTIGTRGSVNISAGLVFTALTDMTIDSFTIYAAASGSVVCRVTDAVGNLIDKDSQFITISGPSMVRLGVNLDVPKGVNYRIDMNGTTMNLMRNTGGAVYPYTFPGVATITNTINGLGPTGYYYYMYNWKASGYTCLSKRIPVTATITTTGMPKIKFSASLSCTNKLTTIYDSTTFASGSALSNYIYTYGDGFKDTATASPHTHIYKTSGSYRILVTVNANNGCSDTSSIKLSSNQNPVAGFNNGLSCFSSPLSVFSTSSSSGISGYTYTFGDTTSAVPTTSGTTTHTYTFPGVHKVTQTILATSGCQDTISRYINIYTPPSPTTTGASACGYGVAKLTASSGPSGFVNRWYATSTSDTVLHEGDTFTTPYLTSSKTYYARTLQKIGYYVGAASRAIGTSANIAAPAAANGLVFQVFQDMSIDSVTVYPNASGRVRINVLDSATGLNIDTVSVAVKVTVAGSAVRIPVGFYLKPGKYQINAIGSTTGGLWRNSTGAVYPYKVGGIVSISRTVNSLATYYYFFYNWKISGTGCPSKATAATATFTTAGMPKVKFGATLACFGKSVMFYDSSTFVSGSALKSFKYAYGDATTDTFSSSPHAHIYATTGKYTVFASVTANNGCTDTGSIKITVNPSPVAGFITGVSCASSPVYVTSTASGVGISGYTYDFGDTSTLVVSGTGNTSHTYSYINKYKIIQTVTTGAGCKDTVSHTIVLTTGPAAPVTTGATICGYNSAKLKASPAGSGIVNSWFATSTSDTVLASGDSFMTPAVGKTTTYYARTIQKSVYTLGPLSRAIGTSGNLAAPTNANGEVFRVYQDMWIDSFTVYPNTSGRVKINIIDSTTGAVVDTVSVAVKVTVAGTAVRIPVGLLIKAGKYQITATGSTTGGLWRNNAGASYAYTVPGVVTITRTISNNPAFYYFFYNWSISVVGCRSKAVAATVTLSTSGKPTISLSTPSGGCPAKAISFTDASTAASGSSLNGFSYTFGDAGTYNSTTTGTTTHTYAAPGTYKAVFTISANNGCTDTTSRMIIIDTLPKAGFNTFDGCVSAIIGFNNTGTAPLKSRYTYSFGDTSSYSGFSSSTTHAYSYAGTKSVSQLIVTTHGCRDSATGSVSILATPGSPVASGVTLCTGSKATLIANKPVTGSSNYWYASATSDTLLYSGDTFVTPVISSSTTYYVEASNFKKYNVGAASRTIGTNSNLAGPTAVNGLVFQVFKNMWLDSVTVYPNASGRVYINIVDSTTGLNVDTMSVAVKVTTAGTAVRIPVGFYLKTGKYQINAAGSTTGGLWRNTAGAVYPYKINGLVSITRTVNNLAGYYYIFYNWAVHTPGCASSRTAVKVSMAPGGKPTASFSTKPVCKGQAMIFTDASSISSGSIAGWDYNFGDTTTYTSTSTGNTSHNYKYAVVSKVTLKVTSAGGCTDTTSRYVKVNANPVAKFTTSTTLCENSKVTFVNGSSGATSYRYYFGNGDSSLLNNPTYTYLSAATYSTRLIAYNTVGCTDTAKVSLTINPLPKINFSAIGFCLGGTTSFGDSSKVATGSITSRAWDFGDGNNATSSAPKNTYSKSGTYKVKLTATTNAGCTDTGSKFIVINPKPSAKLVSAGYCLGAATSFTDSTTISSGSITSSAWDYGDGNVGSGTTTSHTYRKTGAYTVRLLVTSSAGCKDSIKSTLTINPAPKAKFSVSSFCEGSTTIFSDSSSISGGTISNRAWAFGDGNNGTGATAGHIYAKAGTYNAKLSITSDKGCMDTLVQAVTISTLPSAAWTATTATNLMTRDFKALDSTAGLTYAWYYGDTTASGSGQKPTHTYKYNGNYMVSLVVTNNTCSIKHDSSITINSTSIQTPLATRLQINVFPNPFRESVNVTYNLTERAYVKIQLLDVLGRVVATLNDGMQPSGAYQLRWDEAEAKAGTYFLRMSVDNDILVKEIVKIK